MHKIKVDAMLRPVIADVFDDLNILYAQQFSKTGEYYTFSISEEDATMYMLRGGIDLIKAKCRDYKILP